MNHRMSVPLNRQLCVVFCGLTLLKVVGWLLYHIQPTQLFGGGNDSDYYDAYARELVRGATSWWPIVLRWLYDIGLYNRDWISFVILILASCWVPLLGGAVAKVNDSSNGRRAYWWCVVCVALYVTPYYLTLDIYRDDVMLAVFVLAFWTLKQGMDARGNVARSYYWLCACGLAGVLIGFRPYLGVSLLIALLFGKWVHLAGARLWWLTIVATAGLMFLYQYGALDRIIKYRELFENAMLGGSNLGIDISGDALQFLASFTESAVLQIGGFWLNGIGSAGAFVLESIPFILLSAYVLRNRYYADNMCNYIFVFFVVYGVIWTLGNDNMGTAVRLRIFNYICVYWLAFRIHQRKIAVSDVKWQGEGPMRLHKKVFV